MKKIVTLCIVTKENKVPRSKQTEVLNTELAFLVLKPPRGAGYLPFVPPAFGCRELLRFARLSRHLSFGGIKFFLE